MILRHHSLARSPSPSNAPTSQPWRTGNSVPRGTAHHDRVFATPGLAASPVGNSIQASSRLSGNGAFQEVVPMRAHQARPHRQRAGRSGEAGGRSCRRSRSRRQPGDCRRTRRTSCRGSPMTFRFCRRRRCRTGTARAPRDHCRAPSPAPACGSPGTRRAGSATGVTSSANDLSGLPSASTTARTARSGVLKPPFAKAL